MGFKEACSLVHILVAHGRSLFHAGRLGLEKVLPLLELPGLHGLARTIVTDSGPIRDKQIVLGKAGGFECIGPGGVRDNRTVVGSILGVAHDVRTDDLSKLIVVARAIGRALLLLGLRAG